MIGLNKKESKGSSVDITLVFTILFLIVFGIIMIYSSSYYASYETYGNHIEFLKKQTLWCIIGVLSMYLISQIPYKFITQFWLLIYGSSIVCLILVLFIGDEINGARRWLDLKIIGFQPSELAKLATIIAMAVAITSTQKYITNIKVFLLNMLIVILPTILIGMQNMSTAFVVFAIGSSMVFVALPSFKAIFKFMILPCGVLAGLLLVFNNISSFFVKGYQMGRWETFINGPWSDPQGKGYQTIQSLYAVGSGGLFGKGLGYSMQKNGFIPEAHNDIIFSIVCEELGLFGAIALILLFILLIWRCMVIASKAKNILGLLIVSGVMVQIAIQVIINIAVVTNSMPTTGMPLPFISYGGSSLLFLMIEMGLVLNVSRYTQPVD
ncbi:MAG: cell division protein [Firmicutes bacterium HGW-Firmicutes-7]|nr:MAG: cell division protein [Firmicutes bacterium HGW-Firmicutes-7]